MFSPKSGQSFSCLLDFRIGQRFAFPDLPEKCRQLRSVGLLPVFRHEICFATGGGQHCRNIDKNIL
jgi:hypothetical protein